MSRRDLFRDLVRYLPSKAVPIIVSIAAMPIVTRLFGPDEYGEFVLVTITSSLMSAIATSWLSSSAIRLIPAYQLKSELGAFYSTLIAMMVISVGSCSIVFLSILYLSRAYISASLFSLMAVGVIVFVATSCSQVFAGILRGNRRANWFSVFSLSNSIGGLGIGVALILIFGFDISGLLYGVITSQLLSIPFLWKTSIGFTLGNIAIRSTVSREVIKYGIPAMLIGVLTTGLSIADRYILGLFMASREIGIYSIGYNISEKSVFFVNSLLLAASTPIAFSIWESKGEAASQDYVTGLMRLYFIIAVPITTALILLAKQITRMLVSPAYYEGYRVFPLVAVGAFLVGIAHRFTLGLVYQKRTDLLMYCYLGAGILNVVLNFLLVPRYGFMAAAATTLVSYFVLLLLTILVSRHFFVWKFPFASLVRTISASVIMGGLVRFAFDQMAFVPWINLCIVTFMGAGLYVVLLYLLREIQSNERKIIRQTLKRVYVRLFSS